MIYYIGKALASIILVKYALQITCRKYVLWFNYMLKYMCFKLQNNLWIITLRFYGWLLQVIFNYMHNDSKYLNRNAAILTVYIVPYIDMLFMNLYSNTQTF